MQVSCSLVEVASLNVDLALIDLGRVQFNVFCVLIKNK